MSSIESQVVRTNDPLLVLVSCNVLRKQYAAGKIFGILPHMGYTVPINSKNSVGWVFYVHGPLLRDVVLYTPEPSVVNPMTNKRDMQDLPDWLYVQLYAKWLGLGAKNGDEMVSYVQSRPPEYIQ